MGTALAWMAGGAVAFVASVEQGEAAQLRRVEASAPLKEIVVLGIERTKCRMELFVLSEREHRRFNGMSGIREDVCAEHLSKFVCVGCRFKLCRELSDRGVGHFVLRK